ncbi:hypothetical protein EON68_04665, partial [archaeon]
MSSSVGATSLVVVGSWSVVHAQQCGDGSSPLPPCLTRVVVCVPTACLPACSNVDLFTYVDAFPRPGETIFGSAFQKGAGGKGANQAVAASCVAAASSNVRLIACVGADTFGKEYMAELQTYGVDTSSVTVVEGEATGTAAIWVNAEAENCIVVVPAANSKCTAELVRSKYEVLSNAQAVVCQLEVPLEAVTTAFSVAKTGHSGPVAARRGLAVA